MSNYAYILRVRVSSIYSTKLTDARHVAEEYPKVEIKYSKLNNSVSSPSLHRTPVYSFLNSHSHQQPSISNQHHPSPPFRSSPSRPYSSHRQL
ncbi:hypothetical protein QL285_040993 [Trifolium repens]|nr:hypothetical protein QL285_040993 [Trifolium repens]